MKIDVTLANKKHFYLQELLSTTDPGGGDTLRYYQSEGIFL